MTHTHAPASVPAVTAASEVGYDRDQIRDSWALHLRTIATEDTFANPMHTRIYRAIADDLNPWAQPCPDLPPVSHADYATVMSLVYRALTERGVSASRGVLESLDYRGTVILHFASWPNYAVSHDLLRRKGIFLHKAPNEVADYGTWAVATAWPRISALV